MEEVSNTDLKKVEASTPVKETRSKEESPTEAGAGPVLQSSQEVLLSSHTYNSPGDEHSICETNEDGSPEFASESSSICNKCKPQDVCKTVDKHSGVQLDSSEISGNICRGSLMSADSMESELNSESSGELLDNNELIARKKKREKRKELKSHETEDPEEEFRKHFLKTFQNLPRISQISLDDNPKQSPTEQHNAVIDAELSNNEVAESLTNEGDSTGNAILPTNLSNSDAENIEQPDNNIAENTEITLLQNNYIQEKENADEIPSSLNKNM